MPESVTLKGKTFALQGKELKVEGVAPDCELVGADLNGVKLSTFKGKWILLLSVPSLDTPVCSKEAHQFNKEVAQFKDLLNVVCVSMDLPFAQSRWCGAEGVKNLTTLSDYRKREFGENYGVLIPELGLLARAVFLLDPNMVVKKRYLVKEITEEPDYQTILDDLRQMTTQVKR